MPGGSQMNRWRFCGGLVFVAALALGVSAYGQAKGEKGDKGGDKGGGDKGEKLEWTAFTGKQPFYQEMTTTTEQKMKVMASKSARRRNRPSSSNGSPDRPMRKTSAVSRRTSATRCNTRVG